MAFKIGEIVDFSRMVEIPQLELPKIDMGGAPRKIDLSSKEEEMVRNFKAWVNFADFELTKESLFNFFNEWQSDKLKSVKRFVLSLSFILSFAFIAGVDLTNLELFGLEIAEDMTVTFLVSLLLILFISLGYYEFLRRKDLSLHKARIKSTESGLLICLDFVKQIDKLIKSRNDIYSAKYLLNDFHSNLDIQTHDLTTYKAIKFYGENLESLDKQNSFIERIELIVIYAFGLLSVLAITNSFL